VELAELFADRRAKGHELATASRAVHAVIADFIRGLPASGTTDRSLDIEINVADAAWRASARSAVQGCAITIARGTRFTEPHPCEDGGKGAAQVRFLRDIFGCPYPFPQIQMNPAWLTADVVALAGNIYKVCVRSTADLGRRAGGGGVRGCRHPGTLPQFRAARPRLLGGGLAPRQRVG
jgi:hypothetical protein